MKNVTKFYWNKYCYSDKRKASTKSISLSALTIIISLIFALIITCIIYKDFSLFSKIFADFFTLPFSQNTYVNSTISTIAIFMVAAVAFLIPMKSGLFNIGISGQMMFGGAIATIMAQHMIHTPNGLSQVLLLLISILSAAVISTLIGIFKAFWNVNEVVSSIMLNWIVYFIATMMVAKLCLGNGDGLYTKDLSNLDGHTPNLVFQTTSGESWLPLIILAITVTLFAAVLLMYTTFGKKIIMTGMSLSAAKYAGYSVKLNQILAMTISGIIAGIMGVMVYLGQNTTMPVQVAAKTIPQQGFVGISVGLIAMSNPWGILPVACLFGMIDGSKGGLSVNLGIDPSISDAIFGIVVYGAAVISIFYFLVPYQWYLRIFKGKVFANNYQQYINRINHYLDDAQSAIHYLKQRVNHKKNIEDHELILARLKEFKIHLNEHQPVTKQAFYQYSQQIYQAFFQYKNKSKAMLYQANNENEWTIK